MAKRVLFDCDGVLLALTDYVLDWLGSDMVPNQWDFLKQLPKADSDRARLLMSSPWFWKKAPVVEGAQQAVEQIRQAGCEIGVLTSPWRGCKEWSDARYWWLQKNFDIHPDFVMTGHSKWWVGADAFIDDKPEHVFAWCREHRHSRTYLFDRPGNRDIGPPPPGVFVSRITWKDRGADVILRDLDLS